MRHGTRDIRFVAKKRQGEEAGSEKVRLFYAAEGQGHVNLPERIEAILFMAYSLACGSNISVEVAF